MMLNSHIMMRNPFVVLTLASSKITSNKYSFPNCFLLLPTPPPPPSLLVSAENAFYS